MGDNSGAFGFGKFVPGFDFLQNIAKGGSGSMPQMPSLSNWIAPTLSVEELEKRISELKAVQFWLDQNSKALSATVQALEVQKMTLATLKGMNFSMNEMAEALKVKVPEPAAAKAEEPAKSARPKPAAKPEAAKGKSAKGNGDAAAAGAIDPLQWWGALTQQFQEIAANAMKDAAQKATAAAPAGKTAAKAAPAKKAAAKSPPRKGKAPAA